MAVKVGVFGGAFDPPHVGHVELARAGIERFDLDRLLVRVVEQPGHKDVSTAAEIRLFLSELAFAPLDEAEVSLDPFARTVDSLEALALDDPVFLVGADEFADFASWKEPARVLQLARLGVDHLPLTLDWKPSENVRVFVPIGLMIVLSIVGTIVLNVLLRR